MSYFSSFPIEAYNFGNEVDTTFIQNISAYADVFNTMKNDVSFYEQYEILDNERPDILSHKLYGTTEYYWTFFLMNDSLKTVGWPVTYNDLVSFVKKKYPNTNLVTQTQFFDKFAIGETIVGQTSASSAVVTGRDVNLGHIIVKGTPSFQAGETIQKQGDSTKTIVLKSSSLEYLASRYHNAVDSDNLVYRIDIDPTVDVPALVTPVTHIKHYENVNNENKRIRVITSDNILTVVSEFSRALKEII